jgi:hypothetical protein
MSIPVSIAAPAVRMKPCSACAGQLEAVARKCWYCGGLQPANTSWYASPRTERRERAPDRSAGTGYWRPLHARTARPEVAYSA